MGTIKILGGEGKAETKDAYGLLDRLFMHESEEVFRAVGMVGMNTYQARRRELDLVLIASWNNTKRRYNLIDGERPLDIEARRFLADETDDTKSHYEKIKLQFNENSVVFLNEILATIEIKQHSPESIEVIGDSLYVRYPNGMQCVTDKLIEQAETARQVLREQFQIKGWIYHFIYLPNVSKDSMDIKSKNVRNVLLFRDSDIRDFIRACLCQNGSFFGKYQDQLKIGGKDNVLYDPEKYDKIIKYYQGLVPSRLEQEKMEFIAQRFIDNKAKWHEKIGKSLIAFVGRAGTGKTVKLIRTAKDLLEMNMETVLLLTFNKALARDLQRLMQLQKVSLSGSISVLTIDQFLYRTAKAVNLLSELERQLIEEEGRKSDRYELIRELLEEDLKNEDTIKKAKYHWRSYTMVAIDEAQDWLESERNIILSIYSPEKIFIAAGWDQCLRSLANANWKGVVQDRGKDVMPIADNTALRQKTRLTFFNNELAKRFYLDWNVKAFEQNDGGHVYLFEKFDKKVMDVFFEEMLQQDTKGYRFIDYLILMTKSKNIGSYDHVFNALKQSGIDYWDAFNDTDRGSLPELDKVRCVSMESCRGLEGWATILFGLDAWIDFTKERAALANENMTFESMKDLPIWSLIPFTRAKDRMLIELPRQVELREELLKMAQSYPDFIERIN